MSRFLHLSDLHLKESDHSTDDHKITVGEKIERFTSGQALRETLSALGHAMKDDGVTLDGVLISGDVTEQGNEYGFQQLEETLNALDASNPGPDHTVVVPGNHDVKWGTPPSVPERYESFIKHIRSQDYITPLLDGIDFDSTNDFSGDWQKHYMISSTGDAIVIPINSSNYCGSDQKLKGLSDEDFDEIVRRVEGTGGSTDERKLLSIVKALRQYDIPRISPQQFRTLNGLVNHIDGTVAAAQKGVRIAVIHHQLLPVSTREEFKPFESITNLGLLRTFLREHGFRLVVHGHKHESVLYRDSIYDYDSVEKTHSIWVVSGASGDAKQGDKKDICRLIDVNGVAGTATLKVTPIPMSGPGLGISLRSLPAKRALLWETEVSAGAGAYAIEGDTIDQTYQRVMACFSLPDLPAMVPNFVCHVREGASALKVPTEYPDISYMTSDKQKWFTDLVSWWQRPSTNLHERETFNHGSRVFGSVPDLSPQFERVIAALKKDPKSSRAIIAIFNPFEDHPETDKDFPSFCLVQFVIRESAGKKSLHCNAYFRKQEMRFWWPVNIGELALLQQNLVKRLNRTSVLSGVAPGSLTTFAALAHIRDTPPRVAIPDIDRAVDTDPHALFDLAYGLFHLRHSGRAIAMKWTGYLDDLIPAENPAAEGFPIAIEGIAAVLGHLNMLRSHHPGDSTNAVIEQLTELLKINRDFSRQWQQSNCTDEQYDAWRVSVTMKVRDILQTVTQILAINASRRSARSRSTSY